MLRSERAVASFAWRGRCGRVRRGVIPSSLAVPVWFWAGMASGQQASAPAPSAAPISLASVAMQGVTLSGYTFVKDGRAIVGNNTSISAGDATAALTLTRGGSLNVCATTKIHLSADITTPASGLMIALDRGSLEAHYTTGQYSDVLLTPDLRILISPPGNADLRIRVGDNGDTCVDNHGDAAPYVLASSLFGEGAYRVQPNQRVLFEHGSLSEVVDNEQEPCGCPAAQPLSVASAGVTGATAAAPGEAVAEKPAESRTAAQNPFPLAESEGLKPAPTTGPAVPPGETHVQVTAPLAYDGNAPHAAGTAGQAMPGAPVPVPASAIHTTTAQAPPAAPKAKVGFFGHIGRFFRKMFGG